MNSVATVRVGQEENFGNLKSETQALNHKLEYAENKVCRSNLRFQGLPKSVKDLQSTITALCQELAPEILIDRPELDKVHTEC